ncbi:hypothetical protein ACFE04_027009 [Oxalis oulophora]
MGKSKENAKEHKDQLERLREKDPEFYEFLKENDDELLKFDAEDIEDDVETDVENAEVQEDDDNNVSEDEDEVNVKQDKKQTETVITSTMVDTWCNAIVNEGKLSALRSLLRAFRIACHYGDDTGDEASAKFSVMSSAVFNKTMIAVLTHMDGILRDLMKLPASGGKKEHITELMTTRKWKRFSHIVKSYLGNALHVLNQMTDAEMISYTLRRLKYSSFFLTAFPSLLRKYIKVTLHFWGTGGGALPIVSFLFLRDLCVRIGSDCLDECFKGIYKAYVVNCRFVNAASLRHIHFLQNCVIELLRVDISTAYQHAFVYIRQLAMILREALNVKTKESFRKVYEWKYMNCLELWTGAVCAFSSEADFRPLAYPLTQIISGVARLVPTARYFPLRLRCVRMLNRIAASTGSYIPVSMLLLDMLDMKELNKPPTGGVGQAVDLRTIIKVSKPTLKTRSFQEACVFSVVEELAEHLSQWSYSVAFFELAFIPAVQLRSFTKATKVERFRKEVRHFIRQIEANSQFTNEKRSSITYQPNDSAAASFLEDEKKAGISPLSKYCVTIRQKAQQKEDSLKESSVLVGEDSSVFDDEIPESDEDNDDTRNEQGAAIFSSSWLPTGTPSVDTKEDKKKKRKRKATEESDSLALDEDIVEDLIISSDEESAGEDEIETPKKSAPAKQQGKNPKNASNPSKNNRSHWFKSKKKKQRSN